MKHHYNTRRGRQLEALVLALLMRGPHTTVGIRIAGARFQASWTGLHHALRRLLERGVITRESLPVVPGEKAWPGYRYTRVTRTDWAA